MSMSTISCVGADLAAAGGIHRSSPLAGATTVVQELAHWQRVRVEGIEDILTSLQKLCERTSGLA